MSNNRVTIWTIGHSTRPIVEFLDLLREHSIETLIDVRRFPVSKRQPQFNEANLRSSLASEGIGYMWIRELGGRRTPLRNSVNTGWRNEGFRGYADHMSTPEFADGFNRVTTAAAKSRVAIMCAEAVWWRCHRGLISDALTVAGMRVVHILGTAAAVEHPMTQPAKIVDGKLSYTEK